MTRAHIVAVIAIVATLTGCAATLAPAPGVARVPGPGSGAIAEEGGLRVVARTQAWRGYPGDLERVLTPFLISIENNSPRPLSIRYEHFTLESPDGRTFAAIPPFDIATAVSEPLPYTAVPWPRFAFGSPWPPGSWAFGGPFWTTGLYYDPYYPAYQRVELPTGDMVQKALPERTLAPGERVTGFLYFEDLPRDVRNVDFTVQLVEPGAPAPFGAIRIPFVVE